jgi:2-oxoacid:acceptor oxidoreductase delta subunit (pyruvate/2-ketoisovalerate family)
VGLERYEGYVRRATSTLTYDPGWSLDNRTGSWRSQRPVKDPARCNDCGLCWLYCPEGCVSHGDHVIDLAYCKGCGICVVECRRGALSLEREGE